MVATATAVTEIHLGYDRKDSAEATAPKTTAKPAEAADEPPAKSTPATKTKPTATTAAKNTPAKQVDADDDEEEGEIVEVGPVRIRRRPVQAVPFSDASRTSTNAGRVVGYQDAKVRFTFLLNYLSCI